MRIFHVATLADWQRAKPVGTYTTSTYGASLADVGFLHAARADQVPTVVERFYADVDEPILVLEIDTDLLDVPWQEDEVDGDTFPHIYGPLNTSAVVGFHSASRAVQEPPAVSTPPVPAVAAAFYGLSVVLGVTTVVLVLAGFVAHNKAHEHVGAFDQLVEPTLSTSAEFLVWTLAVACGATAVAAVATGAFLRQQPPRKAQP